MFLFGKSNDKKKHPHRYFPDFKIELFGEKYKISFYAQETDDTSYDIIMNEYNYFLSAQVQEQIQDVLKKFVEENYFYIIEINYYDIDIATSSFASLKERDEYSAVQKDIEDGTKNAMEIVLKNIKPSAFEVFGKNESTFYLWVNDFYIDEIHVAVAPEIKVDYPGPEEFEKFYR